MTTIVTLSELKRDADSFLEFKRAMGHPYKRGAIEIDCFLRFVGQHWDAAEPIPMAEAVRRWCGRLPGRKAVTLANEFGVIRQLCLYRRRYDPTSYVPEHSWAPVKESTFFPYIFSQDEVRRILTVASVYEGPAVWASMLRRLVLVLYCTGLRLGEAVRLKMADVDLERGTLTIRDSKRRTRIVPMRDDLVEELRRYIDDRRQLLVDQRCEDPQALFVRRNGMPLTTAAASDAIRRILRRLGIKPAHGRVGARPYEFRHNSESRIIPSDAIAAA
ncbi:MULTISPECIES: tyrosine-type recombinase/integrase [unclassified Mesorhizobium]|uniref:tyrosine-type recombinase/integrase n=1 Tax=unclassified Mesorhizobium TaxID=325217 RepID=UPI000FD51C91|nr:MULTISPECIES: tyrosine-type recombinase/integrase [unclassified Mesorhizobium]RUU77126.1 integrase [Mesorhizobium sp. M7A.F.Ca.MR.362.00.0.0]RWN86078.1 MAG: integrase [Mesorhizobium sp.]RWO94001.1 MAG: integrase [Mesorhizobium sp.]TIM52458.1 MAG: integrase [Mesorhizobium sp.]